MLRYVTTRHYNIKLSVGQIIIIIEIIIITIITRTVRKSDYTPALALPKHMAGILDEKCREKEKYREEQIGECPISIPRYNLSL